MCWASATAPIPKSGRTQFFSPLPSLSRSQNLLFFFRLTVFRPLASTTTSPLFSSLPCPKVYRSKRHITRSSLFPVVYAIRASPIFADFFYVSVPTARLPPVVFSLGATTSYAISIFRESMSGNPSSFPGRFRLESGGALAGVRPSSISHPGWTFSMIISRILYLFPLHQSSVRLLSVPEAFRSEIIVLLPS